MLAPSCYGLEAGMSARANQRYLLVLTAGILEPRVEACVGARWPAAYGAPPPEGVAGAAGSDLAGQG